MKLCGGSSSKKKKKKQSMAKTATAGNNLEKKRKKTPKGLQQVLVSFILSRRHPGILFDTHPSTPPPFLCDVPSTAHLPRSQPRRSGSGRVREASATRIKTQGDPGSDSRRLWLAACRYRRASPAAARRFSNCFVRDRGMGLFPLRAVWSWPFVECVYICITVFALRFFYFAPLLPAGSRC